MILVLAGLLLLLATAAPAQASAPRPPLSTKGAEIVDADGRPAILQGVNWFGFETANHAPHGLWSRDHRDVLAQVRRLGFNTVRLPFSLQALRAGTISGVDFSEGRNAALRGKTPLEAMDVIVDAAAREGLLVLLDNHSLADDGYQYPLWYGQAGLSEDDWVEAWKLLATRYRDRANVIGADLKNEPHGPATWGTGGATDWRRAATRAGEAVTAIAPHWLVVVEGIEGRVAGGRLDRHWWGGNLEGVRRAPVELSRPGRVVYSPHEYGPGVFAQPWFADRRMSALLEERWDRGFGYLVKEDIAPVLVGEFGGREVGLDSTEGRWQRQFFDYLGRTGISWTYWALNPNSGDTGGVLRDDWVGVNEPKMSLLRRLLGRERIEHAAGSPPPAAGAARSTPAPPTEAPAPPAPPAAASASPPAPPARPAAASASPPAPVSPAGRALTAVVRVDDEWARGWCGRLEVTGPARSLGDLEASFTLPRGTSITQSWNAELSGTTGRVRLRFPDWARTGEGAPYTETGFCVSGSGRIGSVAIR